MAFIDYKKAFHTVNRTKLFEILNNNKVSKYLITNLYNIYTNNLIAIRVDNKLTAWKPINRGVRQGYCLSPLLFIIYMNTIIREWRQLPHGNIMINRRLKLDTILYADDQVLIADSEDKLQISLHNLNKIATKYDMEISTDKTKILAFRGKDPIPSKICINNTILERVTCFNYLGYSLSLTEDADISNKVAKFLNIIGTINSVLKPNLVQKETRLKIYKTLARPILAYGCEAWTIRARDASRITAAEMRFMRRTAGYTRWDHKRNDEILQQLKIESIHSYLNLQRQNWLNHINRMERTRIPRQILHYTPRGTRSIGRPAKRWIESATDHMV